MNKTFISLLMLFLVVVGLITFQATRQRSSLVMQPNELVQASKDGKEFKQIRIGGRVAPLPIEYVSQPLTLKFSVQDRENPAGTITVEYNGVKPDMFDAGRDVLLDGDFVGGTFRASKLLTQCPSKYEPPAPKRPTEKANE